MGNWRDGGLRNSEPEFPCNPLQTGIICSKCLYLHGLRVTAVIESLPLRHRFFTTIAIPSALTIVLLLLPCSILMQAGMTDSTKGNQVLLGIIAGLTAEFLVVNLKIPHGAAGLASPAVTA